MRVIFEFLIRFLVTGLSSVLSVILTAVQKTSVLVTFVPE